MAYQDQWNALSGRIRGLMQASQLHAQYLSINTSDPYGMTARLREQSEQLLGALTDFRDAFAPLLPSLALSRIEEFVTHNQVLLADRGGGPGGVNARARTVLVSLGAFESEMSFVLSDMQQRIRSRSERAFKHLQRQIIADPEYRKKWQGAFERGETDCEKLGAVHLLLHGIWAFKVNAEGERTDLVFQEPVGDVDDMQSYVDGLVLTEWKKVNTTDAADEGFVRARNQASHYAAGALAGTELAGYRYAVVVSPQHVNVPVDRTEGGVTYRHVNIAVEPQAPSRR